MTIPKKSRLVLIVDDDDELRQYVEHVLQSRGYTTIGASNGFDALSIIKQKMPDLIILDLVMQYMDGLTTCNKIRGISQCPIIVLSALKDEPRKVAAFEEGADDYLTKPFGSAELMARVNAVLRRSAGHMPGIVVRFEGIEIDLDGNIVKKDGVPLRLTRTELSLLKELAKRPGQIVAHQTLLRNVWGPQYRKETEYLHVYIGRLRRKLEKEPKKPRYIITEPGIGYRLMTDSQNTMVP